MKNQSAILCLVLFLLVFTWGCAITTPQESHTSLTAGNEINSEKLADYSKMLSHRDEDVLAILGEGEPSYQDEGNTIISTRLYQSNLLGFDSEVILIYNSEEEPTVNEVLISFNGVNYHDVIDAVSQQLGDAVFAKETTDKNPDAQWQRENTVYSLTSYEGNVMLGIWKNYGTATE